jgi:rubrerythrin
MPVRGLDFAGLSLQDALDLAILIEDEAHDRYEEFAAQMEQHCTPDAARFFRFMAQNEAKHGEALSARRRVLFGDAPRLVAGSAPFDVEAPDYDEARAFMTPRQAMGVALRSERKARSFFEEALPAVKDEEVRRLFQELREEEVEHEALVRAELAKLPADPPVDEEDFVDPPAPQ